MIPTRKVSQVLPVGLLAMPPLTLSGQPAVAGSAKVKCLLHTIAVVSSRA